MQVIKKIFLIIYVVFLGFIVFCNTSVFGADYDGYSIIRQADGDLALTNYFINCEERFDTQLVYNKGNTSNAYGWFYDWFYETSMLRSYNYIALPMKTPHASGSSANGWRIFVFSPTGDIVSTDSTFSYVNVQNYYYADAVPGYTIDSDFYYPGLNTYGAWCIDIYSYGYNHTFVYENQSFSCSIPLCLVSYSHEYVYQSMSNTSGSSQVANAIQQQTNTIKEESQKQQNAVSTATQKQTNELLDTNNTGNETMSVNDTTTDTSADLSSIYNNISSAFTTYDPTISWGKDFVFTLPNGDNFTINLDSSLILNFLDDYPVLKAFYQSIFWVIFGGYVIFDFKKIINKMKEGNIDNVVGTSSPVDSVVNMSLK